MSSRAAQFDHDRRRLLRSIATGALACAVPRTIGADASMHHGRAADLCATPARFDQPLAVPGAAGLLGYLPIGRDAIELRARTADAGSYAFHAAAGARAWTNPTFVARTGDDVRITLANALAEPTIVHWHGLTIDTRNDGNGDTLVAPGASFDYRFRIRNRGGLYWYHPHPHGATAGQAYRGLIGLLQIEDANDDALRRALQLEPGSTEIPLILHDRRSVSPSRYEPAASDLVHGWYGDEPLVNFTPRAFLEVARRRYRLRIVNAANARIYRIGLRRDDGAAMPFDLIGTDGGLLERAIRVTEVLVAPAERIDVVVDFADIASGGFALLESGAFDPMHAELAAAASPSAPSMHGHGAAHHGAADHVHRHDGGAFAMLQFRVERSGSGAAPLPAQLSTFAPLPEPTADERPLRLGFAKGRWRINDRVFDMTATPIVVARNAVETWLLRNYHSSMPHSMHLHGFQFRVLERQTSPDALASLALDARGRVATDLGWKDTVLVWPGESVRVAIDFRHPFPGEQIYMFHCHNLEHEDGGMMLRVKVG